MVIYLDEYRKAKAGRAAARKGHEEDRMCVNCRSVVALQASFSYLRPHELSPRLPDDLASIDVETFLDRVYGLASQI